MTSGPAVETRTVSIRALTIDGRKMTLSVYRQLERGEIIDGATGALRGTPWGYVNHHSEDCGMFEEHLHLVWESGGALRVDFQREFNWGTEQFWKLKQQLEETRSAYEAALVDAPAHAARNPSAPRVTPEAYAAGKIAESLKRCAKVCGAKARLLPEVVAVLGNFTAEGCDKAIEVLQADARRRDAKWAEIYEGFRKAGQLFIAA